MYRDSLRRAAFTLIEMLVAIGIIAVLLAILLPVLVGARRSAQVTQCASNLRQIGVAIRAYVTEQNRYPAVAVMPAPFVFPLAPPTPIYDALSPYLSSKSGVYRCPGDTGQIYDKCVAVSPLGLGISYLYVDFPSISVAKDDLMWDYTGDSLRGLLPPTHKLGGGNVLRRDGSVHFFPGQRNSSMP